MARRQEQESAREEVTEVAAGVLRMELPIRMPGLGHVNCYALLDREGAAVVDPGLPGPGTWRAIRHRLRRAGLRVRDVHTVVVTHSHPDHFGGAGRLAKAAGAELVTHHAFSTWTVKGPAPERALSEGEARRAEMEAAAAAQSLDVAPDELPTIDQTGDDGLIRDDTEETESTATPWGGSTPWGTRNPGPPLRRRILIRALRVLFPSPRPTRRVHHGEHLVLGGREWWAVHTPGHTVDHLCLYDPEHGLLLSGDHVLPSITPHVSGVGRGGDSLRSYLATLDLVGRLEGVELALPAHGHPFTDLPGRVEAIKRHHEERMELLADASRALGAASVDELAREVFPRKHWGIMAESETFAHLEHMVHAGRAERVPGARPRYRVS